jgi:hypothetical protein
MSRIEVKFNEWMAKITEKLMFYQLKKKEHREITEEEYDLLFMMYKDYRNGEFQIFRNVPDIPDTNDKVTEQGFLFTDNKS